LEVYNEFILAFVFFFQSQRVLLKFGEGFIRLLTFGFELNLEGFDDLMKLEKLLCMGIDLIIVRYFYG
jgi:hypothetical protein